MRERKNFAERAKVLKSDEAKKKYFLVYEGKDTELIYFDAIERLKEAIGINPLIEFVPIVRSYSEEGWSNPKKILDRMIQNIEEAKTGNVSYETLLNWLMDYFQDEGYIFNNRSLAKSVWNTLKWICTEKLQVTLDSIVDNIYAACEHIVSAVEEEFIIENIINDLPKIINYSALTYSEGLDKVCFIVDRDKDSFTFKQYQYVLEQCRKRGFGFYLTNPCFEFWLLMHFDDVTEIDEVKLLDNPIVPGKRRYSEQELRKRIFNYKKSKYNADALVKNIDRAIENEKKFCEDIEKLEKSVGSNIGLLITEMRSK